MPGIAAGLIFLLETLDAVGGRTEVQPVPHLKPAFDSQAANRRDVLERALTGGLIDVAGISHAVLRASL